MWSDSLPLPPAPAPRCSFSRPRARRLLPPALRVDPLLLLPGVEERRTSRCLASPLPGALNAARAVRPKPGGQELEERGSHANTRAGLSPPRNAGAAAAGGAGWGDSGRQAGTLGGPAQRPTPHPNACTKCLVLQLKNRRQRRPGGRVRPSAVLGPPPQTHLPSDPRALANYSAQPCPGLSGSTGNRRVPAGWGHAERDTGQDPGLPAPRVHSASPSV